MKLLSLIFLRQAPPGSDGAQPVVLSSSCEVSSFGFFQRSSVKEFCIFLARLVGQRTAPGTRQRMPENDHVCYTHAKKNGLCGVIICDEEYPQRVAFSLLAKALDDFEAFFGRSWTTAAQDNACQWPDGEKYLKEYQDPSKADKITAIQRDLDETKVVMQKNIDSVLQRGEKLDVLVEKSNDLSMSSKTFYKTAKKHNQCCCLM